MWRRVRDLKNSYLEDSLSQAELMGIILFCQNPKEKLYTFPPSILIYLHYNPPSLLTQHENIVILFLLAFKGRKKKDPNCTGSTRLQFCYIKEMMWNSQIYLTNPQCLFRTGWGVFSYLHMLSCEFITYIILRCLMSGSNRKGIKFQTMRVMKLRDNEIECKSKAVWLNQIVHPIIQFLLKLQQLEIKLS